MVDCQATRERFKRSPYKITGWSVHRDLNPKTVVQFLHARRNWSSPMGQKIIEALRADGLLVETDEEQAA